MNTAVFFIRHGDVDNPDQIIYGRRPFPLTPNGITQLRDFALYSKNHGIVPDVIYTSPMVRARQSAEALQQVFPSVKLVIDERFQEVDCGFAEGKPLSYSEGMKDPHGVLGGSNIYNESPEEIIKRMQEGTREILEKNKGKTVFVVSHGDPLAFFRWSLLHPEEKVPVITSLHANDYLDKGKGWKAVFDEFGKIIEHEKVDPEKQSGPAKEII